MSTIFVDANVFLRFFTRDDEGQHEQAARLLRRAAAGKVALVAGPPILFELAWVLRSAYGQPREKVLEVLDAIATLPGLHLTDSDLAEEAIDRARQAQTEYADAYIAVAAMRSGADRLATFNRRHFAPLGIPLADL